MTRYTAEVVIRRTPEDVFAYMDDVTREREWQPNLVSGEQEPPGPTRAGSRKRYVSRFMGRRVENTYEVLELEPARRLVQRTLPGSSVRVRSEMRWESVPGGTRLTITVDASPTGIMKLLPAGVLETAARGELNDSLARLKRILESG